MVTICHHAGLFFLARAEANVPPRLADGSPHEASHPPQLVDRSPRLGDDSHREAGRSPRLADRSPRLGDGSHREAGRPPRLVDRSPRLGDDSHREAGRPPRLVDRSPRLGDDSRSPDKGESELSAFPLSAALRWHVEAEPGSWEADRRAVELFAEGCDGAGSVRRAEGGPASQVPGGQNGGARAPTPSRRAPRNLPLLSSSPPARESETISGTPTTPSSPPSARRRTSSKREIGMRSSRKEASHRRCSSSVGDPLPPSRLDDHRDATSRSGMPEKGEALPTPPPGGGILRKIWWRWLPHGRREQSEPQDRRAASRSWCPTSPKTRHDERSRGLLRATHQAPYSRGTLFRGTGSFKFYPWGIQCFSALRALLFCFALPKEYECPSVASCLSPP
jgi:hypothetical protein